VIHSFARESCARVFTQAFGHPPPVAPQPFSERIEDTWWAWLPGFPLEEPPLPRWIVQRLKGT
ncbi:MAG: hypothetical protein Q8O76_07760, partial [Chloroflexota bacterium]|nr:hypothetical protein [Chloroflexota bacterium]